MKNFLISIGILFTLTAAAAAQGTQGRVVDLLGVGVAGVTVECVATCFPTAAPKASATTSTTTDANGNFVWPVPGPPGAGSGCLLSTEYAYTLKKDGYAFTRGAFLYRPSPPPAILPPVDERISLIQASSLPAWANVSAASFANTQILANDMIVAGFGANLATQSASATPPLPTLLAGRRVAVRDVNGLEKFARLLFVAPTQINYVTPVGLADGPAVIRVLDEGNNTLRTGLALLQPTAPGIFTANASGQGVPAAIVVRVKPGNLQSYEPVARFDDARKQYVPAEIDLGPESEFLVLSLFGTGWRQAASPATVYVNIGNEATGYALCPVEYIGAQPTLDGLDQINVRLSRALLGKGEVSVAVSINGVSMNLVQLKIK